METEAKNKRGLVGKLKDELTKAEIDLRDYETKCVHKFETYYDPVYTPAYTIPGDKPGTMGVDFRGPIDVPANTKERWRRECGICGLIQYTTRTYDIVNVKKIPKW
jgi:hypothetical protein